MREAFTALLLVPVLLAGCSGSGSGTQDDVATGDFEVRFLDDLSGGTMRLGAGFAKSASGNWSQAFEGGTTLTFDGDGENLTVAGKLPAGTYDTLRILLDGMGSGGDEAILTETGIEVTVTMNVTEGQTTVMALAFSWKDGLFESEKGLAFTPALRKLVLTEGGVQRLDLEASQIQLVTKNPVARMRVFDETGLEVFRSTFVAEDPEDPVIGNAGVLTLSASESAAVQAGATLSNFTWDVQEVKGAGTKMTAYGQTVRPEFPIAGGRFKVALTVTDSEGSKDTQVVEVALWPAEKTQRLNFTGTVAGVTSGTSTVGGTAPVHAFMVNRTTFNGSAAQLKKVFADLSSTSDVAVCEITLEVRDSADAAVVNSNQGGCQDNVSKDVTEADTFADGEWDVRVRPDRAYGVSYTLIVDLTWKGVNPQIEAFLAEYDDGHDHQH